MSDAAKERFFGVQGGRLFTFPYHYQTSSDGALQLNAAADWALFGWTQECDAALSSLSVYITAVATEGDLTLALHNADANGEPDGDALLAIGTLGSGDTADQWVRTTCTATQLYRGHRYCIVFKGEAAKDFSLSYRRMNTTLGSSLFDGAWSKYSTDSGSSWNDVEQDSVAALLNVVLNSTADHIPQLWYGRYTGPGAYVKGEKPDEIQIEGVSYDCTTLTADTVYYTYLYRTGNGLALDCSTTVPTNYKGLRVKTGTRNRPYVGKIYPKDVFGSGDQAPVDVMDSRLILNVHNKRWRSVGKSCPYTSNTYDGSPATANFEGFLGGTHYKAEFLADSDTVIPMRFGDVVLGAAGTLVTIGIAVDTDAAYYDNSVTCLNAVIMGMDVDAILRNMTPGYHYTIPIQKAAGVVDVYGCSAGYAHTNFLGTMET